MPPVFVDPKIQKVRDLYADPFTPEFYGSPVREQLELQARRLLEAHRTHDDAVCFQIESWHPALIGKPDATILGHSFTMDDARITIAREYGFRDWDEVIAIGDRRSDPAFEQAVNAMLSGDLSALRAQLRATPALITARSQYGHRATLLHYAGNNGVESYRQVVPRNLADVVELLLASGADPAAQAGMYGGSTPLALFETSAHPHGAGVRRDVIGVFKQYEDRARSPSSRDRP